MEVVMNNKVKKIFVYSFFVLITSPALVAFGGPLLFFLVAGGLTIAAERLFSWVNKDNDNE